MPVIVRTRLIGKRQFFHRRADEVRLDRGIEPDHRFRDGERGHEMPARASAREKNGLQLVVKGAVSATFSGRCDGFSPDQSDFCPS
jgi:hypothetical protein